MSGDNKPSRLAKVALALGVIATGFEVWELLDRSDPKLLAPEQVLVKPHTYQDGQEYLRVAARLSYLNSGSEKTSSVVEQESVRYTLAGVEREQYWLSNEVFVPDESDSCKLKSISSTDTHPFVVKGQSVVSNITYFTPRPRRVVDSRTKEEPKHRGFDYLLWSDFLAHMAEQDKVVFVFTAKLLRGNSLEATCQAEIDDEVRDYLEKGCAVNLVCVM